MPVIAVCNPKGGVGKTTLSLNIATQLKAEGAHVELVDLDLQGSLSDCVKQRPDRLSRLNCSRIEANEYFSAREQLKTDDNYFEIVDCPAALDIKECEKLIQLSDKVLIPTNASRLDVNALTHFIFSLARLESDCLKNSDFGIVVNRAKKHVKNSQRMINWFEKIALPTVGQLRDTVNYAISTEFGIGVTEMPTNRAHKDIQSIRQIYDWITH